MRTVKGLSEVDSVHGEITLERKHFYERNRYILVTKKVDIGCLGYRACISMSNVSSLFLPDNFKISENDFSQFREGDYVSLVGNTATFLWEQNSLQNAFMLTEACNCNCLMCPQPPKKHDPNLLEMANNILSSLRGKTVSDICITGGEPTVLKQKFISFLKQCTEEHPEAHISILTNAKTFSDMEFATQAVKSASDSTVFCVSLHSDIDSIHDRIVGTKSSHMCTEQGIYNLAKAGANIEIRHVITRLNYKDLSRFSDYLYSYFPFAVHYAMMGMEVYGYAEKNIQEIYISPHEYIDELQKAVLFLSRRGLPVSIYNIPLCLCSKILWKFTCKSISNWKNSYLSICETCLAKEDCAGFFATSQVIPKEYINPIKEYEHEKDDL